MERLRRELLKDLKILLMEAAIEELKPWLKSYEVCKLLRISSGTLQNLRDSGKIKFSKVGGIIFYFRTDIDQLLKQSGRDYKITG
ncbi:MAG: DNA-binding protein [Pedobacter sp.]|nr:MAG: DNA-binding protein [Pedobacter sp.]